MKTIKTFEDLVMISVRQEAFIVFKIEFPRTLTFTYYDLSVWNWVFNSADFFVSF